MIERFGNTEVDHFDDRAAVVQRDEHVRRLDVAVNDPLLVRVLNGLADGDKQFEALPHSQPVVVAVRRDGDAVDQLHHKIGPTGGCRARIENPGDVGMVHEGQRLPFGLEAVDHVMGVHPRLDDFEGHPASDRLVLLGNKDEPKSSFSDLLDELVRPNDGPDEPRRIVCDHR